MIFSIMYFKKTFIWMIVMVLSIIIVSSIPNLDEINNPESGFSDFFIDVTNIGENLNLSGNNLTVSILIVTENLTVLGNTSSEFYHGDGRFLINLNHTLDQAYDSESGVHIITIDNGDINFDQKGNDINYNLTTVGGDSSSFDIILHGDSNFPSTFNIFADHDPGGVLAVMSVSQGSVFSAGRTPVQSASWVPFSDNTFDLGQDVHLGAPDGIRWRDLYLAGTIKGQGTAGELS
ncbi:hypothetical protein LCGC14_2128020, partial [marine sediment metagenome]